MIAIDTSILLYGLVSSCPEHPAARGFLERMHAREDVALSEFVLVELYRLLRNPAVVVHPLEAKVAAAVIDDYRHHPRWRVVGFTGDSRRLHDELWHLAGEPNFAFRRIFDSRLALTLLHHGVSDLATSNAKAFEGFGFRRVWDPTAVA